MKKFTFLSVLFAFLAVSVMAQKTNLIEAQKHIIKEKTEVASPVNYKIPSQGVPESNEKLDFILNESFETWPPQDWTFIENSTGFSVWHQRDVLSITGGNTVIAQDGTYYAMVNWEAIDQDEWMITPSLDFSGLTNTPALDFYFFGQYYWSVSPNDNCDLFIKYSLDNGATWTQLWTETDAGEFETYMWTYQRVMLESLMGESNVKFAFNYVGNDGAQFGVDKVRIYSVPEYELVLGSMFHQEYGKIPADLYVPFVAKADVYNGGIVDQSNITVSLNINDGFFELASSAFSMTALNNDTIAIGNVNNVLTAGTYNLAYSVTSANEDADPSNNTGTSTFDVTNNYYTRNNGYFTGGQSYVDDAQGSVIGYAYEFKAPTQIYGVNVVLGDNTVVGAEIVAEVYLIGYENNQWTNTVGFELLGYSDYFVVTEEMLNSAPTGEPISVNIPILDANGEPLTIGGMENDQPLKYMAAIKSFGGDDNAYIGIGTGIYSPNYRGWVYYTSEDTWYYLSGSFNTRMIGFALNDDTGVNNLTSEDLNLSVYPNPVQDKLNVSFSVDKMDNYTIRLVNITGQTIYSESLNSFSGSYNQSLDMNQMASGLYLLQLVSSQGTTSIKVIR